MQTKQPAAHQTRGLCLGLAPRLLVGTIVMALSASTFFGCGQTDQDDDATPAGQRLRTSTERFAVGMPEDYANDGIYLDFYKSHGVFLVNNRGMLVALSAESPNTGHTVKYDASIKQYVDARDGSRYTQDGLPTGAPNDRKALERCRLSMSIPINGTTKQLIVDPGYRFRFEDNQWSKQHSFQNTRNREE